MPALHPFIVLFGISIFKKVAAISLGYLYGWPRIYRLVLRTSRELRLEQHTQQCIASGVKMAIRLPNTAASVLRNTEIARVVGLALEKLGEPPLRHSDVMEHPLEHIPSIAPSEPDVEISPSTSATNLPPVEHFTKQDDWILLSEFSELEGPVPLFSIPETASHNFKNMNDFVLRIMAVDRQASKAKENACLIPDMQVVLSEPDQKLHAFVHHFSLLDIHARGYVRPFAMVYLSSSSAKIMTHFESLLKQFTSVSSMLKESNSSLFIGELEQRVTEMRQTMAWISSNPSTNLAHEAEERLLKEAEMTEFGHATLKDYLTDLEDLLRRVKTNLQPIAPEETSSVSTTATAPSSLSTSPATTSLIEPSLQVDPAPSLGALSTPPSSSPPSTSQQLVSPTPTRASQDITSTLQETLAPQAPRSSSSSQIFNSPAVASIAAMKSQIMEHLSSVQGVRNFEKRLRPLAELCAGTFTPVLAKFRAIQKHFTRSLLQLRLEAEERGMIVYHLTSLHIGSRRLLNYADHLPRAPRRPSDPQPESLPSSNRSSAKSVSLSTYSGYTTAAGSVSTYASASTSHASLPSVRVSMPDQLASLSDARTSPSNISPSTSPSHLSVPSFGSAPTSPMIHCKRPALHSSTDAFHMEPSLLTARLEREASAGKRGSVADMSALPPAVGRSILDLQSRFPFLRHMLFSLLKGRTLVIIASPLNEQAVRQLTRALSYFVPRNCTRTTSNVLPWRRGPLRVVDLNFKLLGVAKGFSISKAVEKYASILDYEQEMLKAPPYARGDLIDDLINPRKQWPSTDAYLEWAYSRMLALGCKSCLYYQVTCSGANQPSPSGLATRSIASDQSEQAVANPSDNDLASDPQLTAAAPPSRPTTTASVNNVTAAPVPVTLPGKEYGRPKILRDWGIPDHDAEILEYWVEVVKEQQANFEVLECAPIIRIDHSVPKVFKTTRGVMRGV